MSNHPSEKCQESTGQERTYFSSRRASLHLLLAGTKFYCLITDVNGLPKVVAQQRLTSSRTCDLSIASPVPYSLRHFVVQQKINSVGIFC